MKAELSIGIITLVASVGTAWGYVKTSLRNKIDYGDHHEMCGKVQDKIFDRMNEQFTKQVDILMEIKQDIGELKGEIKNRS